MDNKKHFHQGFTLVELLVVISIIGILSSFAVVSLNTARMKARDALRKGDMAQLRTALNIYYDDNIEYPICGTWNGAAVDFGADVDAADNSGSSCYYDNNGGTADLATALTSGARPYMGSIPKDPKNPTNDTGVSLVDIYRYVSNGEEYAVVYNTEDTTDDSPQVIRGW